MSDQIGRHHRVICSGDLPLNGHESRAGLSRAFRYDPEQIVRDIVVRRPSRRSQTRSRDVSDPVTDPGVRVPVPEVGSLTSRLLSAVLWTAAKAAALSPVESRGSVSANFRSVSSYAHGFRSASPRDRFGAGIGTSPRRGEMDALASSPLPSPPRCCVRYFAKPAD
jgi:hypothetical protein